ncbi:hypothetical protein ONZ43_g3654 [Nemania bipapillata]|uniref:Uncharacterized protein n=1 Tax=Nemania bipapillata TaxID=110536 RepID=A0ACC2IW87_9PEZI|nr:hypothetical protein ONZ43_g3654 [Nemania bipapillata]
MASEIASTWPKVCEMRTWLQTVCSVIPQGRSVVDEVEAYARYLLLEVASPKRPTDEDFIAYTDTWIRRSSQEPREPGTMGLAFFLSVSCFSEEWIMKYLGPVFSSLDVVGEDGPLLFYNFLVSRYEKVTEDTRQVQSLSSIVENFRLGA